MSSFSVSSQTVNENGTVNFTVELQPGAVGNTSVKYRFLTGPGFGTLGNDFLDYYNTASGQVSMLSFAPGETSKTITYYSRGDSIDEVDQNFTLELFDPVGADLAGGAEALRVLGVELDDDGAGTNLAVFTASPIILEGDAGTSLARFEIRLSRSQTTPLTLNYTTLDGSATAGSDYVARSGTVTLAAGQTSAFVDVTVNGDTLRENAETFFLRVTPPAVAASPAGVVGTATILNDDTSMDVPSVSIEPATTIEAGTTGFVVRLDEPSVATVTLSYRFLTGPGLGTLDNDFLDYYNTRSGEASTLTFAPGETSKTIIYYSRGDSADEVDQNFTLEVFDPVNAQLAGGAEALRALGVELDNDGAGTNLAIFTASPIIAEGDTGHTIARFEIRLSQPANSDLTLNYTTLDGTAIAGSDYVARTGTVTFAAGQTSAFIDVTVNGDTLREEAETFFLRVTPTAAAASPAGVVGTATILNDDTRLDVPSVSVESATTIEAGATSFIVRLDEPSVATVSLSYRFLTGPGFGTLDNDFLDYYNTRSGEASTLTFAPGETSKAITYYSRGDSIDEVDQSFTLEVFDPVNAELAGGAEALRVLGVELDNDGTGSNLAVFVGSPLLAEGDAGTTLARFEIRLSQPHTSDLTLSYATQDGSALAGSDYVARSGTITIAAGQTSAFVDVTVNGDTLRENAEIFFLRVAPPAAASSPAGVVGTATILNDDTSLDVPSVSIEPAATIEAGATSFIIRLDEPSVATVTLSYRFLTGPGFGTLGSDVLDYYNPSPGQVMTLTFAPGETTKAISYYSRGDSVDEIDQNFTLEIFNPVNAELAGRVSALRAVGIELDNDGVGDNLAILGRGSVTREASANSAMVEFEVRLSRPASHQVKVNYSTADGSAIAGQDYIAANGVLTFEAGETVKYVFVPVISDVQADGTESLSLNVSPGTPGVGPTSFSIAASIIDNSIIGTAGNDALTGTPDDDYIIGHGGNDQIVGGLGSDILTGGAGADVFAGTAAELNGDTITDLAANDIIRITNANVAGFAFALNGSTLTFTGGTMELQNLPAGVHFEASPAAGGGVDLRLAAGGSIINNGLSGDYNGDGRDDILWRSDIGQVSNWLGQANGSFAGNDANALTTVPINWKIAGAGDFNGDGRSDILWRSDTGALSDWLGQPNGGFAGNDANAFTNVPTNWKVVGVGDFNGDGRDDILWRNDVGHLSDWLGQPNGGFAGNDANAFSSVPTSWHVVGVGDFNGDGRDDILWRSESGQLSDWLGQANGGFAGNDANAFTAVPGNWHVVGVGDFNGDNRDDILWRSDDGQLSNWLGQPNGGFASNDANAASAVPLDWQVAGVGDFNGDGRDDVLWRNTGNGALSDWLGQPNGGFAGNDANAYVPGVPLSWQIQIADNFAL